MLATPSLHVPGCHILPLDLLEIQLWEDVEPVGDLDDEEELEHEGVVGVGIALPEHADVGQVLPQDDVSGPEDADQVERQQLTALVELGVLDLGQMKLAVHLVQEIFLKEEEEI